MSTDAGVPIKLLHEGEGHVITVELKNGEIYKGMLAEAEDTMNCQMKEVIMTARNGRVVRLENVFLRGANIKFIVLPDLLKSASVLKKVQGMKAKRGDPEGAPGGPPSKKSKHVRF
ncbi:small nuclear ribonucleoprotein-associated protein D3 [Ochromonadaceae sp. CCMP2298]|nr:small nuclear ribonucleoprotein-associated protein D3 [Ochromonadaceae sp. CCMP2298]|mmetsp:Transcript_1892/g.4423  ORF Transcript_1892/g.4423 Transcript_1892/m.4423 type:complete len:116 (+) Transcript_1892:202-549(+)